MPTRLRPFGLAFAPPFLGLRDPNRLDARGPGAGDEGAILADIVARLVATRLFDAVALVEDASSQPGSSDYGCYATAWPTGGDDLDDAMSGTAPDTVRHGTFSVAVDARGLESGDRQATLSRLVGAVKSALNNQSLAGSTFPALTLVRRDTRSPGSQPTGRVTFSGEYTFIAHDNDFAAPYAAE